MNITIFPKPPADSKGFVRLRLSVSINNKRAFFPSKVKVLAESWNQSKQTITSKQIGYKELNGQLTKRKGQLTQIFQDLEYEKIAPTVEIVHARYMAILEHKVVKKGVKQIQLLEYIDQYVKDRMKIRSVKGYLRKFTPMKNWLIDFNPEIQFSDITLDFYNAWISHMYDDELESNTVSGYVKKLKSIMGAAVIDPRTKHQDIPVDFKLFKDTYIKPKPIWLDWETELALLEKYNPPTHDLPYKQEFLFRCYTGLRHVDLFNSRPENFIQQRGKVYLDFMSIKTRADQNLQLNEKAIAILKAWDFKPPKLYQSDCNERIKVICEKAGIKTMTEKVRFSGNERKISLLPKHELVTTHTARRSFGRRWMENGGELRNLSIYYGHSTEKQTAEYIGWTTEEVNNEMMRVMV